MTRMTMMIGERTIRGKRRQGMHDLVQINRELHGHHGYLRVHIIKRVRLIFTMFHAWYRCANISWLRAITVQKQMGHQR